MIDPTWIEAGASLCGIVGTTCSIYVSLQISRLRTDIEIARRQDREEMRNWIEASFMRAAEAQIRLDDHARRIEAVERIATRPRTHSKEIN